MYMVWTLKSQRFLLLLPAFYTLFVDVFLWQALFEWWRARECLSTETHLKRETFTSSLMSNSLKTTGLAPKNWMWVTIIKHPDLHNLNFIILERLWCHNAFCIKLDCNFSGTWVLAACSHWEPCYFSRCRGSWPDRIWQESRVRKWSQERGLQW